MSGNPGGRRLNLREPKPTGGGVRPAHLDEIACAEWDRVAPLLREIGVLKDVDSAALAGYCSAYSVWVRAEQALAKLGGALIRKKKSGELEAVPYLRLAQNALDQMRKFMVEFGMTPSSRSRLTGAVADAQPENPFAEIAAQSRLAQ